MTPFLPLLFTLASLVAQEQEPRMPADTQVVTTSSGLQYCVLAAGQPGAAPKLGDKVKLHYSVWHANGKLIDSSKLTGQPPEVECGAVMDGWNEALQLMTPGARWKLTIPGKLAYGPRGNPPEIGPNETLVLEVEMLSFTKAPPMPEFHPGHPELQKKTESGILYEPLVQGTGPAPHPDDVIEIKYAVWSASGHLVDCCEKSGSNIKGRASDMTLRFLQIAPQYLTVGSRYRFEVPAELCRGLPFGSPILPADSVTVWELELVSATEVKIPPFVAPDPANQKKTASGLLYEVLQEGTGAQPKLNDKITVNYAGWLADGLLFDASYLRGQPYPLVLKPGRGGVIDGWVEGIALMKVGARYRFQIPPNLAYRERGSPPKIPANATLIFEIELLKVGE